MIVETGRIVRVVDDAAWVESASRQDCARCAEGRGCGGGLLGRWLGQRLHRVQASNPSGFAEGSWVEMEMPESRLLLAALLVYLPPLFGMLVGSAIAAIGFAAAEGIVVLAALLGLAGGMLVTRVAGGGMSTWASPRLVRRLDGPPAGCVRERPL